MFHAGLQFRPCNALSKHAHTHTQRDSTMTKNRKQNTNEKEEKTLQTVLSTIVMKMAKRKDSERPPPCSCFTTGSEDSGKWKGQGNCNGNRKQCKNYENSYLCMHTLGGKFAMLQVLRATCHSGWQAEPKFACVNGMQKI